MAADPTYPSTFQVRQDGNAAVPTGKSLDIESGGALKIAGTDVTTALATAPAAVAAGYKIARGETALDGSNPTPVSTGLTTVVAFVATLKGTAAPGVGTSVLTASISGATANVYADRKSTRLNSSHVSESRMPSSA